LTVRIVLTAPVAPALTADWPHRAPQRMTLRRSVVLRAASAAFSALAVGAVWSTLAPYWGNAQALPVACATLGALVLGAKRFERRQPTTLQQTADGVIAWDAQGRVLCDGPVVGAAQWTGSLLMLTVGVSGENGKRLQVSPKARTRTLLISADSLPHEAFRSLAVLARRQRQA
jgi:hypothetical protein